MAQAVDKMDQAQQQCAVCHGSGVLLNDPCPLCDGDVDACNDIASSGSTCHATARVEEMQLLDIVELRPKSPLCLVLDIDGTLLSESAPVDATIAELRWFLRPHVHDLLDFAFLNFTAVGLWTAASCTWLEIFKQVVDPASCYNWAFTWSGRLSHVQMSLGILSSGVASVSKRKKTRQDMEKQRSPEDRL
jgi:hypothetical protein